LANFIITFSHSSLQNLFLFTSAIDFNVVNPSNNTLNRKKIIITIFVNETKCIFEKNYKKKPLQKSKTASEAWTLWQGGGGVGARVCFFTPEMF
jgi:hypothetical protein